MRLSQTVFQYSIEIILGQWLLGYWRLSSVFQYSIEIIEAPPSELAPQLPLEPFNILLKSS